MASAVPLALVLGVAWFLSRRGLVVQTLWAALNVLDTLRALRTVAVHAAGPVLDAVLGWVPFYAPLRAVLTLGFLSMRIQASAVVYDNAVRPLVRKYETPIDLTVLLVHALLALVGHYALLPARTAWAAVRAPLASPARAQSLPDIGADVVEPADLVPHAALPLIGTLAGSAPRTPTPERPATPPRENLLAPPQLATVRRSPGRRTPTLAEPTPVLVPAATPRRRQGTSASVSGTVVAQPHPIYAIPALPAAPTALVAIPILSLPPAPTHDPGSGSGARPSAPRAGPSRPAYGARTVRSSAAPATTAPASAASSALTSTRPGSTSASSSVSVSAAVGRAPPRAPSVRSANLPAARAGPPVSVSEGDVAKRTRSRPAAKPASEIRPIKPPPRARKPDALAAARAAVALPPAAATDVPAVPVHAGRLGPPARRTRTAGTPARARKPAPADTDDVVFVGVGKKRAPPAAGAEPRPKRARKDGA
ncbi:hypothetical protein Q5752_005152 [Cryptotrichosporon argae]